MIRRGKIIAVAAIAASVVTSTLAMHKILTLVAAITAASTLSAQSWTELVDRQWPGDSIRKVSEKDFDAFVAQHQNGRGKAGALDAFLSRQLAAHGHASARKVWPAFAVPAGGASLIPTVRTGLEALLREGAEPNGNPSQGGTPTPIACGDQADGSIDVGADQDWYVFTLTAPAVVQALTGPGLAGPGLPGTVADTVIEIYDSSLALIGFNDDYTVQYTSAIRRGAYSICELPLGAGTYFVSVRAFGATQTGSYTFDLRCDNAGSVVAEGPEPNGDPANGEVPTPLALGTQADGNITFSGDWDWYQLNVVQPTALILETGPSLQNTGAIGDSILELRDVNGLSIATDDDGGAGAYSQILVTLQPGTYFANVSGFGQSLGTYRLFAYVVDVPANPVAEAPEPNGDPRNGGTPSLIGCDQVGVGDITVAGGGPPAGDDDWWTFTTTAAGWVTVFTLGDSSSLAPGLEPCNDTELWLYDAAFTELAYDDDNGLGLYSEVSAWLPAGTYHARVEGFGAGDVGNYFVTIECSGGVPGFANLGGGCATSRGAVPTVGTRDLEQAMIGTTFVIDHIGLIPSAAFFPWVGLSNTQATAGFALPFDITFLGAPGCSIGADPLVVQGSVASAAGTGTFSLFVPNLPSLAGSVLFTQAIVVDAAANTLGLVTSDVGVMIVGSRF